MNNSSTMVIQISDEILKKAQDELFSGAAYRDLSMCITFDKSKPVAGVYNWSTLYGKVSDYMKSNGTYEKYNKWVSSGNIILGSH